MAIVNRTKDATEQRLVFQANAGATATGVTGILCMVPSPGVIEAGQLAAFGLSGAPNVTIVLNRFIAGAGATAITIATGTSNVVNAYGTSGVIATGMVIAAAGSTLLNVLANDVLMYQTGVANAAVTGLSVNLVIRPIQDVRSYFGVI